MTRRRTLVAVGVVLAAVLVVGILLTQRNDARPVGLDEAKARTTSTGVTSSVAAADSARPDPGVYEYEGSGTDALSVPPLSQEAGPTMPATVALVGDDCWTFRIDYSTNHWQEWEHCLVGDDLVESGGTTWQRWMIGATAITNTTTVVCDPGAMVLPSTPRPDQRWTGRCVATNGEVEGESVSEGPYRYVGEEELEVDGTRVATRHFVSDRTMSGAQVGTDHSEVWVTVEDGLPVRNEHRIEVRTDTVVGESTYTETGEFHLVSLEPA